MPQQQLENRDSETTNSIDRAVVGTTRLGPGLAVCAAATAISVGINRVLPAASPLLIAIVLGAVLANLVQLPQRYAPGLQFSANTCCGWGSRCWACN